MKSTQTSPSKKSPPTSQIVSRGDSNLNAENWNLITLPDSETKGNGKQSKKRKLESTTSNQDFKNAPKKEGSNSTFYYQNTGNYNPVELIGESKSKQNTPEKGYSNKISLTSPSKTQESPSYDKTHEQNLKRTKITPQIVSRGDSNPNNSITIDLSKTGDKKTVTGTKKSTSNLGSGQFSIDLNEFKFTRNKNKEGYGNKSPLTSPSKMQENSSYTQINESRRQYYGESTSQIVSRGDSNLNAENWNLITLPDSETKGNGNKKTVTVTKKPTSNLGSGQFSIDLNEFKFTNNKKKEDPRQSAAEKKVVIKTTKNNNFDSNPGSDQLSNMYHNLSDDGSDSEEIGSSDNWYDFVHMHQIVSKIFNNEARFVAVKSDLDEALREDAVIYIFLFVDLGERQFFPEEALKKDTTRGHWVGLYKDQNNIIYYIDPQGKPCNLGNIFGTKKLQEYIKEYPLQVANQQGEMNGDCGPLLIEAMRLLQQRRGEEIRSKGQEINGSHRESALFAKKIRKSHLDLLAKNETHNKKKEDPRQSPEQSNRIKDIAPKLAQNTSQRVRAQEQREDLSTLITKAGGLDRHYSMSSKKSPLYHYTNAVGYDAILSSKKLNASQDMTNARTGDGQYFTDIKPTQIVSENQKDLAKKVQELKTQNHFNENETYYAKTELAKKFYNMPFTGIAHKLDYALEIKTDNLPNLRQKYEFDHGDSQLQTIGDAQLKNLKPQEIFVNLRLDKEPLDISGLLQRNGKTSEWATKAAVNGPRWDDRADLATTTKVATKVEKKFDVPKLGIVEIERAGTILIGGTKGNKHAILGTNSVQEVPEGQERWSAWFAGKIEELDYIDTIIRETEEESAGLIKLERKTVLNLLENKKYIYNAAEKSLAIIYEDTKNAYSSERLNQELEQLRSNHEDKEKAFKALAKTYKVPAHELKALKDKKLARRNLKAVDEKLRELAKKHDLSEVDREAVNEKLRELAEKYDLSEVKLKAMLEVSEYHQVPLDGLVELAQGVQTAAENLGEDNNYNDYYNYYSQKYHLNTKKGERMRIDHHYARALASNAAIQKLNDVNEK